MTGISRLLCAAAGGLFGLFSAGMISLASADECGPVKPCAVEQGFYLMRPPAGWDRASALPTAVFFHGYGATAQEIMQDENFAKTMSDLGVLLVVPNGNDRGWSFPGKIQGTRDDFTFVDSVLADVAKRVPIDRARLWATGFSVGGSMTWYLSCFRSDRFAAFAPIAGAFWEPMPETCPGGPVSLRHIHGLADKTVPMGGRSLRSGQFKQGDVMRSIAQLRGRNACPAAPSATAAYGPMICQTWSAASCGANREVELCLHQGEHEIENGWIAEDYAWVDRLAKSRAAATANLPPAETGKPKL